MNVDKGYGKGLCATGKYRYDTRCAADRGHRHHKHKRQARVVYRCDCCHGWHLGTPKGS